MLGGEFGAVAEVGHLGGGEGLELGVDGRDVLFGLGDFFGEALAVGGGGVVVAGVGRGVVAVEHALQEVGVGAEEGGVGLGHQVGAVELVVGVAGAVGMDALGDLAEEGFEVEGEWVGCGVLGWRGFGRDGLRRGWVVELGDAVFPVVELDVEDADLADVAAFEAVELGAEVVEGGFAGGEGFAEGGELGAEAEELGSSGRGWRAIAARRGMG